MQKCKKIIIILILLVSGAFAFVPAPTKAATNERMIDDAVFDNSGSMSAVDIQNFLNQFPNSCLKNYTDEFPNDYFSYSGSATAATIIRRVSDLWGISPRVILTKLEQEENLVTGNAGCELWRYVSAVGYNCPGPTRTATFRGQQVTTCVQNDSNMGFSRQVTRGGWLLKFAKERANDNLGWLLPDDAAIQYYGSFVSAGYHKRCGSCSPVYHDGTFNGVDIQTGATASLYNYTPFLNQSFDEIFETWFGSTYAVTYASSYHSQSAYPTIVQGQSATVSISYKNIGSSKWCDDDSYGACGGGTKPVHLSTSNPLNRNSGFGSAWGGDRNRPTGNFAAVYKSDGVTLADDQNIAQPGEIAKFEFTLTAPAGIANSTYREYFRPIVEGGSAMNDPGTFLDITVNTVYSNAYYSQSSYPTVSQGGSTTSHFMYKNTGNMPWYDDASVGTAPSGTKPVHLATTGPINRASSLGSTWGVYRNRPANTFAAVYEANGTTLAADQHIVQPGQIAKFAFTFSAPIGTPGGTYREFFQPIVEGGTTMNFAGTFLDVTVPSATYSAQYYSQSAYPTIPRGSSANVHFMYKNTGNMPWYDDAAIGSAPAGTKPLHLATFNPLNRTSGFGSTWGGDRNRPTGVFAAVYEADGVTLAANQHVAQPGQIAKIEFVFSTPNNLVSSRYREYFQPIIEGHTNMNTIGTFLDIIVP